MALRNLRSDLASGDLATPAAADLTFGQGTAFDRPNGEFSNEPFIKRGLDFGLDTINNITDGFIRGGAVYSTERRLLDAERIGRFLITPKGLTFIAKQIGLQGSNPQVGAPSITGFFSTPANHRTYNAGVNTLAQIAGQGTGLHVNRQGLTPLANEGYADEKRFEDNYERNNNNNRLLYLYDEHISADPKPEGTKKESRFSRSLIGRGITNLVSKFKRDGDPLYSYSGGPGSTYGIGRTTIRKQTKTPQVTYLDNPKDGSYEIQKFKTDGSEEIPLFILDKNLVRSINDFKFRTDNDLKDLDKRDINKNYQESQHLLKGKDNPNKSFKEGYTYKRINPRIENYLVALGRKRAFNYNRPTKENGTRTFHREENFYLGNPGGDPTLLNSNSTVDLINALDVFKGPLLKEGKDITESDIKDLIRFRIEAVNPNNPLETDIMVFRAFLDSLTDDYNGNYNEFNYNGRAESFYTYNSFNRSIGFSFKIAAQSAREMKPLYRKLNYLLSNTAPEYDTTSGRIKTPFMRVTIGDYLKRLPGVITNVGISWDKEYSWEITLDTDDLLTSELLVLPHVLNVSVTYQPIHDFLPQKDISSPFIIPRADDSMGDKQKTWNTDPIATDPISKRNTQTVVTEENSGTNFVPITGAPSLGLTPLPVNNNIPLEVPSIITPFDNIGAEDLTNIIPEGSS